MLIHDTSGNMVTLDFLFAGFGGRRVGQIGYEGFRSHSEGGIIAIREGCPQMVAKTMVILCGTLRERSPT